MSAAGGDTRGGGEQWARPAPWSRRFYWLGVLLLVGIGVARIASTYHLVNHTVDEGAHLAAGIQWFQNTYTYDPKHTPIARIAIAALPYLDGMRGYGNPSYWQEGAQLLSTGHRYWHNLTLARLGMLPFFVLIVVFVFYWSRRLYGYPVALLAAAICSLQPVILANSGVAATDIPLTATFLVAVYALTRWLATPNWRTATGLGLAGGLALATKLSTLVFLPATLAATLPFYLVSRSVSTTASQPTRKTWSAASVGGSFAIMIVAAFFVLWASYRFSHASIDEASKAPGRVAAHLFGANSASAERIQTLVRTVQVPMPEFVAGLRDLRDSNRLGSPVYLFGHIRQGGFWYFYPVGVLLKTPIPVLLCAGLGAIALLARWRRRRQDWESLVPLLSPVAILAISMPTRLDLGARHILPVFAFLSILAAVGLAHLWNWGRQLTSADRVSRPARWAGPVAATVLSVWFLVSSARAHPDYLAYVNELGGSNPASIMVSSDLDWGQDLGRLATYLQTRKADHLWIDYIVVFDAPALNLPPSDRPQCGQKVSGWVAIGEHRARTFPACYQWLDSVPVTTHIGKSMRVYFIPDSTQKAASGNSVMATTPPMTRPSQSL